MLNSKDRDKLISLNKQFTPSIYLPFRKYLLGPASITHIKGNFVLLF